MKLWTIQPLFVYEQLKEGKSFRCEFQKSLFGDLDGFYRAYKWMADQMCKRISPPPAGVEFPVWAWHTRDWKYKKPDLRSADLRNYTEPYVCIELEVPEQEVLLSDFDAWHFVLKDLYLTLSNSEEEDDALMESYEKLSEEERQKVKVDSWESIFDIVPFENDWYCKGKYIQATFWEIKPEYIVDVRYIKEKRKRIH